MITFVKAEDSLYGLARLNQELLGPVMRPDRFFVEVFLQDLPYLNAKFRTHRAEVLSLCKSHKKSTRVLQSFCAHSKSMRDTLLTALVQPLRKCL